LRPRKRKGEREREREERVLTFPPSILNWIVNGTQSLSLWKPHRNDLDCHILYMIYWARRGEWAQLGLVDRISRFFISGSIKKIASKWYKKTLFHLIETLGVCHHFHSRDLIACPFCRDAIVLILHPPPPLNLRMEPIPPLSLFSLNLGCGGAGKTFGVAHPAVDKARRW
jgi:hypothetical protein